MKIYRKAEELQTVPQTSVALGNFDGVHYGHQALLGTCVRSASARGYAPAVFTFSNHPTNVIAGKQIVQNIITFEEKAHLMERLGIEYLFSFPFDRSMQEMSPFAFCRDVLCGLLNMKEALCGFDYRFGHRAQGTPEQLCEMGKTFQFDVQVLAPVQIDGEVVSSTLTRKALRLGDVERYVRLTGRRYAVSGRVAYGRQFGRTIGFPTVNIDLDASMVLPKSGVYLTRIFLEGQWFDSITNVGSKPTVGQFRKNAETHIFDFARDIYGMDVRVEFLHLLREEQKFSSAAELSEQIQRDCERAHTLHSERVDEEKLYIV